MSELCRKNSNICRSEIWSWISEWWKRKKAFEFLNDRRQTKKYKGKWKKLNKIVNVVLKMKLRGFIKFSLEIAKWILTILTVSQVKTKLLLQHPTLNVYMMSCLFFFVRTFVCSLDRFEIVDDLPNKFNYIPFFCSKEFFFLSLSSSILMSINKWDTWATSWVCWKCEYTSKLQVSSIVVFHFGSGQSEPLTFSISFFVANFSFRQENFTCSKWLNEICTRHTATFNCDVFEYSHIQTVTVHVYK